MRGDDIDAVDCPATCYTGGTPTYCDFDCQTTDDYIVFGEVWRSDYADPPNWTRQGIGVCVFESDGSWNKGDFVAYNVASSNVTDYRVRADGTNDGGNDVVRLATPGDYETCRAADPGSVRGVRIKAVLESSDTYLFWGDGGDDRLYLCSKTSTYVTCGYSSPSNSECLTTSTNCSAGYTCNAGRADGREGSDDVYGSQYTEYLWGQDGADYLCGYGASDVLRGGNGDVDQLSGGGGSDWLEGGPGDDDFLYGDDAGYTGDDWLYGDDYGGANTGTGDHCDCSSDYRYCHDGNCEWSNCSYTCP